MFVAIFFQVTTKDGYILSVQRIPEGRAKLSGGKAKKQPVIIQHGIVVVSDQCTNSFVSISLNFLFPKNLNFHCPKNHRTEMFYLFRSGCETNSLNVIDKVTKRC